MVKALRITVQGCVPYEHVEIYSRNLGGPMPAPDFFEDSQLAFKCKHGTFVLPDYNVILVQLRNGRITPPRDATRVKRLLLAWDLNYQDCYIIQQKHYNKYNVPQIFKEYEQLVFICKDGLFVTSDFNVHYIHLWEK